MTIAKASAIAGGLMLTMAVGVWTVQRITGTGERARDTHEEPAMAAPVVDVESAAAEPGVAPGEERVRAVLTTRPLRPEIAPAEPSAEALHDRLKPLLNSGTDLDAAAAGFRDAEQFAAVAHAARNTQVPFMVLKHRVIEEGKSLADAISELNPRVDASIEAERATAEARSDIASLAL